MTKFVHSAWNDRWTDVRHRTVQTVQNYFDRLAKWLEANWFKLLIISFLLFVILKKDLTLELTLRNSPYFPVSEAAFLTGYPGAAPAVKDREAAAPALTASRQKQLDYVERFAGIAQAEMKKYGIPASIKLGQAILETNAGSSPLAVRHNNHFGMKCFSRDCQPGHCANFRDDSHKDFFRKYPSAWESFRSHSELLQGERYRRLFQLKPTDYAGWAQGLQKAGYATDKKYAEKLIGLIETLELYRYDGY